MNELHVCDKCFQLTEWEWFDAESYKDYPYYQCKKCGKKVEDKKFSEYVKKTNKLKIRPFNQLVEKIITDKQIDCVIYYHFENNDLKITVKEKLKEKEKT